MFWNELNVHSFQSNSSKLTIGQTIRTADDASYLAPVENYINGKAWKNNLNGSYSYYMRPPGYSIVYLCFRSWLPEKQALFSLKLFQVVLFGISISALYLLFLEFNIHKNLSILLISFYAFGGMGIGFLYYTLTEGITPALVIFYFYFLIRAKNVNTLKAKKLFYLISFTLFGLLFITRPVLGILALPLPFFILCDNFFNLKKKIVLLLTFGLLGFGPMVSWQIRAYHISGEIVGLHPIYSEENLQTPYRPVHQAFWELAKSWGEKGDDFHAYTDEFWTNSYRNALDTSSVSTLIKKLPKSVVQELGEERLIRALESYRLAILEQRTFLSEGNPMPKTHFNNELKAIQQFVRLKNEYRENNFIFYHLVAPMNVFKDMFFHSNLSLNVFQQSWRGNFFMEGWRYLCAIFHSLLFLLLPVSLFLKKTPKEFKIIIVGVILYIFYLTYFQRGIEETYSLPILALLVLSFGYLTNWIFTKYAPN